MLLIFLLRLDIQVTYYAYIAVVLSLFMNIIFSIYFRHKRINKYTVIERIDYVNKSNFFLRKKDEILFALLSALIGGLVAVISTWLTGHLR